MSEPPDLETLARRYLDLWQDQVSALAADPEFTETLGRLLQVSASLGPAGWMSLWTAAAAGLQPQKAHDPKPAPAAAQSPASPQAAPGAATAAASHHDSGDDMAELRRRLAVLEARLAGLAGSGAAEPGAGHSARRGLDVAGARALAEDSKGPGRRASARPRRRRS